MTAQSEVQTDETKFARQMLPDTRHHHEVRLPRGRPSHRTCASRPGTSRLGADSTGVARIPVPHIPAALVGRRPGGRPWAGGGRLAMPKTWPRQQLSVAREAALLRFARFDRREYPAPWFGVMAGHRSK